MRRVFDFGIFHRPGSVITGGMREELTRPEVRLAFVIVWLVLSAMILGVLASPFLFSQETIESVSPVCVWKAKFNRECPGCGLTRSFLHLSAGRVGDAFEANRAGPFLYFVFVLNLVFVAGWLLQRGGAFLELRQRGGSPCKS